jgi:hypothetical protein
VNQVLKTVFSTSRFWMGSRWQDSFLWFQPAPKNSIKSQVAVSENRNSIDFIRLRP